MLPPRWQGDGGVSFPLSSRRSGTFLFLFWLPPRAGGRVDWLGERAGTEGVTVLRKNQQNQQRIGPEEESAGRRSRLPREGGGLGRIEW